MNIHEIIFSATGRTQKVVDVIKEELNCTATKIDLSSTSEDFSKYILSEDDICIVAMPVFLGRVPKPVVDRIKQIQGNGAKAVLIATFGNRDVDDCLAELQHILNENKFVCVAAAEIVCEHSILHNFGAGRPTSEEYTQIRNFAKKLKALIEGKNFSVLPLFKDNQEYIDMGDIPFKPKGNKKCISCGLCAQKCPVGAIDVNNPKVTDKKACITCMRCAEICPTDARDFHPLLVAAAKIVMKREFTKDNVNKFYI